MELLKNPNSKNKWSDFEKLPKYYHNSKIMPDINFGKFKVLIYKNLPYDTLDNYKDVFKD